MNPPQVDNSVDDEHVIYVNLQNIMHLFFTFVRPTGKDENSTKLSKFIDEPRVKSKLETDDFVAIKIESDSQAYMQFASIYQMVPVPSIFFIGSTGTPLEIATGVVADVEELQGKISKVLELGGKKSSVSAASAMSQAFIDQESKAGPSVAPAKADEEIKNETKDEKTDDTSEVVCEDGVCYKKPKDAPTTTTTAAATPVVAADNETTQEPAKTSDDNKAEQDKLADTRKYLEEKRRERIEEEKRLEKEREIRRRKEGKDMQNLRAWQKDQELKELKDSIKRDRLEEQAARERILAQIAADKAERAQKFATENQASTSQSAPATHAPTPAPAATDETRLQFRFASGDNKTNNFKCSTTLEEVRDYVKNELLPGTGIKEFTLATTYPKREFNSEHYAQTLVELELFPSAVILIIGKEATGPSAMIARQGGLFNIFSMVVMSILNPIFGIFNTAKNWITGGGRGDNKDGNNAQTGAQKRANEERGVQDDV